MTPTKIVNRLVDLGPLVIGPRMKTPAHCVAATRIGLDALAVFGITGRALSVRLELANAAWLAAAAAAPDGGGDRAYWEAAAAAGAHLIDTGSDKFGAGAIDGTNWLGHVVIWLPNINGGGLVDLTMGQMERPAKKIHVPRAASFQWQPPRAVYNLPNGCQVAYTARPDDHTFERASDFDSERVADVTAAVVRALRKGRVR